MPSKTIPLPPPDRHYHPPRPDDVTITLRLPHALIREITRWGKHNRPAWNLHELITYDLTNAYEWSCEEHDYESELAKNYQGALPMTTPDPKSLKAALNAIDWDALAPNPDDIKAALDAIDWDALPKSPCQPLPKPSSPPKPSSKLA